MNAFGLSGPYPNLKKSSSANRLFQIQKQNAKNLRTLKSLGIDTSKVTDDKQNPLFSALEELDQIIGTQGSVEFFSRLAETKTKGGKPWQKGEKEELLAGGVLPWALIGAGTLAGTVLGGVGGASAGSVGAVPGAAAGGVGGAKLAASLLGAAGFATAGYSYAKGQLGLNKYLDYRGTKSIISVQFIGGQGRRLRRPGPRLPIRHAHRGLLLEHPSACRSRWCTSCCDATRATPTSVPALAWVAQAQWLLVAWGYWVERCRVQ